MLTALHFAGPIVHPPHSVSLSRDLRVPASVFEDGGWKGGRGSHPDIQEHGAEDRDRVATDKIVRKKLYCTLRCKWQILTMGLFMCTLLHTYRRQVFSYFLFVLRTLIPILHQKAKRGTPHQAKQAVHCIHAIFNNKEVQLAQIFEVRDICCLDWLPWITIYRFRMFLLTYLPHVPVFIFELDFCLCPHS